MSNTMIILTDVQAETVRGATADGYALNPVQLKNGEWFLPAEVLAAPEHSIHYDLLASLPQRMVGDDEFVKVEI